MNLLRFGNAYGGYVLDLDRIPSDGVVIDAGIGTDLSFADELHKVRPALKFIGVDPGEESEEFVKKSKVEGWYTFISGAVVGDSRGSTVPLYLNAQPHHGSMTVYRSHRDASRRMIEAKAISLNELVCVYRPCVVKMDLEGAEYEVLAECFGVRQIALEFHEAMLGDEFKGRTDQAIRDLTAFGYSIDVRTEKDEVLAVLR